MEGRPREVACSRQCDTAVPVWGTFTRSLSIALLPWQLQILLQLTCYCSPNTCSELRSHDWHGRPTLSNDADHPVHRLAYVSITFQRNLVSTYRIAQITTWNIHRFFITCQLGRITNSKLYFAFIIIFSERTATPKHKSTLRLSCVCSRERERDSCGWEISVLRIVQMNITIERIN